MTMHFNPDNSEAQSQPNGLASDQKSTAMSMNTETENSCSTEEIKTSEETAKEAQTKVSNCKLMPFGATEAFQAALPPSPPFLFPNVGSTTIPSSSFVVTSNEISASTPILPTEEKNPRANSISSIESTRNTQTLATHKVANNTPSLRLNKFVRRLHDMLQSERDSGIVEWRRGLLVLHSTDAFAKKILPKYFNTRNFKTFRRQLNYYGFVHVRSFSATGSTTTALWVNQDLAKRGTKSISSVLMLKRVEPCESAKTAEGRRVRKEEAVSTVEDIGINTRTLQLEQIRSLALQQENAEGCEDVLQTCGSPPNLPLVVHCQAAATVSPLTSSTTINHQPMPQVTTAATSHIQPPSLLTSPHSVASFLPNPWVNAAEPGAQPKPFSPAQPHLPHTANGIPNIPKVSNSSVDEATLNNLAQQHPPSSPSSANDAANLLLMLSRSTMASITSSPATQGEVSETSPPSPPSMTAVAAIST